MVDYFNGPFQSRFLIFKIKTLFFQFIIIALFALFTFTMASKMMRYDESYLKYGITVLKSNEEEKPQCVLFSKAQQAKETLGKKTSQFSKQRSRLL